MSDTDRGTTDNTRMLHELLGAIRGINGDGGLIGRMERVAEDVTTIRITLPTLMTKEDCVAKREACANRQGGKAEKRWSKNKDVVLIIVASVGMIGTIIGIGKAGGWF